MIKKTGDGSLSSFFILEFASFKKKFINMYFE